MNNLMGIAIQKTLPIPEIDEGEILLKFADHLIANVDRLANTRLSLYGLYFLIVGAMVTVHFTVNQKDKPRIPLLLGGIAGFIISFIQIFVSLQIRDCFTTLNYIFNNVCIINKINTVNEILRSKGLYYFHNRIYLILWMLTILISTILVLSSFWHKKTLRNVLLVILITGGISAYFVFNPMKQIRNLTNGYAESIDSLLVPFRN